MDSYLAETRLYGVFYVNSLHRRVNVATIVRKDFKNYIFLKAVGDIKTEINLQDRQSEWVYAFISSEEKDVDTFLKYYYGLPVWEDELPEGNHYSPEELKSILTGINTQARNELTQGLNALTGRMDALLSRTQGRFDLAYREWYDTFVARFKPY